MENRCPAAKSDPQLNRVTDRRVEETLSSWGLAGMENTSSAPAPKIGSPGLRHPAQNSPRDRSTERAVDAADRGRGLPMAGRSGPPANESVAMTRPRDQQFRMLLHARDAGVIHRRHDFTRFDLAPERARGTCSMCGLPQRAAGARAPPVSGEAVRARERRRRERHLRKRGRAAVDDRRASFGRQTRWARDLADPSPIVNS